MVIIILQCRFIINKFGGFMLNTFGQKSNVFNKAFYLKNYYFVQGKFYEEFCGHK